MFFHIISNDINNKIPIVYVLYPLYIDNDDIFHNEHYFIGMSMTDPLNHHYDDFQYSK